MTNKENQQFIFGSVFLLSNKLQLLGDKVTGEITLKQWFLLNMIHKMGNNKLNFQDIAKAIGYSRQNISKMISLLERKGMVSLQTSETDHRSVYVILTQKCLDYFSSKENLGNTLLDTLFIGMSSEETEQLVTLLGRLLGNTESALREEVEV